jgi:hypothetical protein
VARGLVVSIALALALTRATAFAQPESAARADAAFQDGQRLMAAGHFDEACARFAESDKLSASGRAVYNLAECEASAGHLIAARADYLEALHRASGMPELEAYLKQRVAGVDAKTPSLIVRLTSRDQDLSAWAVEVDGVRLAPAEIGAARALDPGTHQVRATRGAAAREAIVALRAGQKNVDVTISVDEPISAGANGGNPRRATLAWVLVGAGGAAFVAGGVLGVIALHDKGVVDDACPNRHCPSQAVEQSVAGDNSSAQTAATLSTIAFGAGVVLAGIGVALLVTSKGERASPATLVLSPAPAGAALSGSF